MDDDWLAPDGQHTGPHPITSLADVVVETKTLLRRESATLAARRTELLDLIVQSGTAALHRGPEVYAFGVMRLTEAVGPVLSASLARRSRYLAWFSEHSYIDDQPIIIVGDNGRARY